VTREKLPPQKPKGERFPKKKKPAGRGNPPKQPKGKSPEARGGGVRRESGQRGKEGDTVTEGKNTNKKTGGHMHFEV